MRDFLLDKDKLNTTDINTKFILLTGDYSTKSDKECIKLFDWIILKPIE